MTTSLDELFRAGLISLLDLHFAKALARLEPQAEPAALLGAALASRAVGSGHVCADLVRLGETLADVDPTKEAPLDIVLPPLSEWVPLLARSPFVGSGIEADPRPLVLVGHRLYLHRYFSYERRLAEGLRERARRMLDVDEAVLRDGVARLFPEEERARDAKQCIAAVMVAMRAFAVVSGGPGTGKTYTVTKVLALLQEQARARGQAFARVRLLAPTGKAAQRLGASIAHTLSGLDCDAAVKDAVPRDASTIHRALGPRPGTSTRFRHDRDNPLPADVVLVDEASMVDVALMAKLVEAVPTGARLILVGDKDQLASVEAGAILGDVYGDAADDGYSGAFADRVERVTGIRPSRSATRGGSGIEDCRIHLTLNRRYAPGSGIARLAGAVNAGDSDEAIRALREGGDIALLPVPSDHALEGVLGAAVLRAFESIAEASPRDRLKLLDGFRVLCAHRRGPLGVGAANAFVERHLRSHGILPDEGEWYDARPIIVTENDYQLELFNGDVGVICPSEDGERLEACFASRDGASVRRLPPARIPPHETVFAMTVHKSQGSEFDHVALLLPETPSPLVTRELLYTGITRARARVTVVGSEEVLRAGIERRVQRASGLREALWA